MSGESSGRFRSVVKRLFQLPVEHPWRVLAAGLLLIGALVPGLGRAHTDAGVRLWYPPGAETIQELDSFEDRFGSDLPSILVVHSPSGIFDKESAQLLVELTARMWQVTETIRVESLSSFTWVRAVGDEILVEPLIPDDVELTDELLKERREAALSHPQLPGYMVSKDGKTAMVYGWLEPATHTGGDNDFAGILRDLEKIVEETKGRGDNQIYIAGLPPLYRHIQAIPEKDTQMLMPAIMGVCVLFLLIFFRRIAGILLPMLVVVPSVLITVAVAGWANLPMNPMTIAAPQIVIAIAVSNSVHLLYPYFRGLDAGLARREAARHAVNESLGTNFFACFTVAVGFLSFVSAPLVPMRNLGILVASGVVAVWLLNWVVMAPLMVLLPLKGKRRKGKKEGKVDDEALHQPPGALHRLGLWIDRNRKAIVFGWLAVAIGALAYGARNQVNHVPIELFKADAPIRVAQEFVRDRLGWSEAIEIVIDSGTEEGIKDPEFLRKVDTFGTWIQTKPYVIRVTSVVDILKEVNRALYGGDPKQYRLPDDRRAIADEYLLYTLNLPAGKNLNDRVTLGNDALRMSVLTRLQDSKSVLRGVDELRAKAKELGLNVRFTGRLLLFHQLNPYIVESMIRSIVMSLLPMALLLVFLFRSVRLGLLSIVPDVVPLMIGAGLLMLLGVSYDMGSVMVYSIAVGMSVDDTVHFLGTYNRHRQEGHDPAESVSRTMAVVPAIGITTAVLVGCFGLLMLGSFVPLFYLGLMVATVLVICAATDTFMLPGLLLMLGGKRNGKKDKPKR
jgi:uncharacterized protein